MTNTQTGTDTARAEALAVVMERNEKAFDARAKRAKTVEKSEETVENITSSIALYTKNLEKNQRLLEERSDELARMDALIEEAVEARMKAEEMRPGILAEGDAYHFLDKEQQEQAKPALDAKRAVLREYDDLANNLELKITKMYHKR